MPTGEISPSALKIDRLMARIAEGDIKIPAFQRGFVWDQTQIIDLLDSIYQNYPIGSILLWSSNEQLKSSRNIGGLKLPDRDPDYPVNYVLDGQQRLSTIYATFAVDREFAEDEKSYSVSADIFEVSFDFASKTFVPTSSLDPTAFSIKLTDLFNTERFFDAIQPLPSEIQRAAKDLYSRFNNYEIPVVTISKRSKDEVGIIFERINSTGTTLTTLDLLIAWTWSEDFHLQEALNELGDTLDSKGFGDLPDRIVLQCMSAILVESTKTKAILALNPEEVRERFTEIAEAIGRAVDFLSTELSVRSLDFLPHLQQIVGLTYFFHKMKMASEEQISTLTKWFWKTSFSRRYSGQTDDKMNADVEFMKRVQVGDSSNLADYPAELDSATLLKQKFSKGNPYTRALLLLMAQKTPLDLSSGAKIDLGDALSNYNRKEYHHIFPNAYLKAKGISTERINTLCNFCFLPSSSNKKISKKAPSEYVKSVVPEKKRREIFESNLMPLRIETYDLDDYERFLQERAEVIVQHFNALVM